MAEKPKHEQFTSTLRGAGCHLGLLWSAKTNPDLEHDDLFAYATKTEHGQQPQGLVILQRFAPGRDGRDNGFATYYQSRHGTIAGEVDYLSSPRTKRTD